MKLIRVPKHPLLFLKVLICLFWVVFLRRVKGWPLKKILVIISGDRNRNAFLNSPVEYLTHYADLIRSVFKFNYLERTLVLFYFLRQWGIKAKFHLGVRQFKHRLSWHSWLTLQGNVVLEKAITEPPLRTLLTWPR